MIRQFLAISLADIKCVDNPKANEPGEFCVIICFNFVCDWGKYGYTTFSFLDIAAKLFPMVISCYP